MLSFLLLGDFKVRCLISTHLGFSTSVCYQVLVPSGSEDRVVRFQPRLISRHGTRPIVATGRLQGPQPPGRGLVPVHGPPGPGPHSRRRAAGGRARPHLRLQPPPASPPSSASDRQVLDAHKSPVPGATEGGDRRPHAVFWAELPQEASQGGGFPHGFHSGRCPRACRGLAWCLLFESCHS